MSDILNSRFVRVYLIPGAIFQSVLVGGGYGTGREIVEFFTRFGALGGLLVLAPLVVGLLHSAWLGLRADRITDATWTGLLNELRGRLQLGRRVTLLELPRPVIPMTWGVLRPVVIVPQAAQHWPENLRRFVLLHELAHVKRWDVPFQLLGRAACAMYWFHPLAWYALRRLRIERELACDDCIVTTGERPSDYAEQLLQIVRTCRPAGFASVGVALARTSHLESRIRALFDRARSHVPLSARGARVLSLAAALLVTAVAVVRPAAREAEPAIVDEAPTTLTEATAAEAETSELAAAPEAVSEPVTDDTVEEKIVRGTVVDPDGNPVAGATVRAQTPLWAMLKPLVPDGWEPPIIEMTSAADGLFEISFSTQPIGDLSHLNPQWAEIWKKTVIAASAPGFGPAWIEYEDIQQPDQPITLKLVEDLPVQGRIVNLEGEPLAGETIKIYGPFAAEDEDLSAWLAAISAGEPPWTAWKKTPKSIAAKLVGIPETVVSDADGRFEIRGVGRERHFGLMFESEMVAHKSVKVATRLMEPLQAVLSTPPFEAVEPVFGARFVFAATPSRTVTGTVRDAETGSPMVGVAVESYSLADRPRHANVRVLKSVTDADGRFRLVGMPKG
ncbi:MAG: M56 family metallopeptidase, partial [Phycisphaeraceae bacterium]